MVNKLFFAATFALSLPCAAGSRADLVQTDDRQLLTLPYPTSAAGRFAVPDDRVWPAAPGEADICLWHDDRFAACAITIDDNCAPDHEWWVKLTGELGIKVTWFVVTGGVKPKGAANGGFNGTWDDFQRLANLGHSIQSHTTNHRSDPPKRKRKPETVLLSDEQLTSMYRDSLKTINDNVTNNWACCLAYPSGDAHPEISTKYAIASRGVNGKPSPANKISYANTNKGSGQRGFVDMVAFGKADEGPKWVRGMKDLKRGLNVVLYHFVHAGRNPEARKKNAETVEKEVRYISSLKDDRLWVCRFDDVMKYAQERDSAALASRMEKGRVVVTLADKMKDDVFSFPLSVKVRLPNGWKGAKARQNGTEVPCRFLTHDGAPYAIAEIVPDRGEAIVEERK